MMGGRRAAGTHADANLHLTILYMVESREIRRQHGTIFEVGS
jgi:hypothetical protein